jgi:hypothetical protein
MPVCAPLPSPQVSCGTAHTLCNTSRGVFSWGCNDGGRLGTGDQAGRSMPVEVPALKGAHVTQVREPCRAVPCAHDPPLSTRGCRGARWW